MLDVSSTVPKGSQKMGDLMSTVRHWPSVSHVHLPLNVDYQQTVYCNGNTGVVNVMRTAEKRQGKVAGW